MQNKKIIIGTRGSDLALWQANYTKRALENLGHEVELKIIKTQGDIIQHLSFDKMEGKGFFTKEIEASLLSKEVDLAVHSHKDLETTSPEGLSVAAVSDRANPADILLINKNAFDTTKAWNLKEDAVIGTSSARRKMQVFAKRPDLEIKDLRGNVPTRIGKLKSGDYDAILLARAGLDRLSLDLEGLEIFEMNPTEFIPAPAQGVLAFQIRAEDGELKTILEGINNDTVAKSILAERLLLKLFKGGCQLPLGAYCTFEDNVYKLQAVMAPQWNQLPVHSQMEGDDPELLAKLVFEDLKKKSDR